MGTGINRDWHQKGQLTSTGTGINRAWPQKGLKMKLLWTLGMNKADINRVGHQSGLLGIKRDGHQKGLTSKSRHQKVGINRPASIGRASIGVFPLALALPQILWIWCNYLFSDPRWQINTPSSRGKPSQNFYSIVLIAKGRTLWSRMEEVVVQEGSEDLQKWMHHNRYYFFKKRKIYLHIFIYFCF